MLNKITEAYFRLLKTALVLCLASMVVLVFGNVVLRYAFNSGITVSEELARLFFLYLTFLGGIVAMREHLHLGVDSIVRRLPRFGKRLCNVVAQSLMLFALVLLLQGSWAQAVINLSVKMPVTGISMAAFYGVGVIFAVSSGLIVLRDLWLALTGKASEPQLAASHEPEAAIAAPARAQATTPTASTDDDTTLPGLRAIEARNAS